MKTKYLLPVEIKIESVFDFLKIKKYTYVLSSGDKESQSEICFYDCNGIIIGKHLVGDLKSISLDSSEHLKQNVAKAAEDVKENVVKVANSAKAAATDISSQIASKIGKIIKK